MKKVWALITALALMLALAVGASAAVPKKAERICLCV